MAAPVSLSLAEALRLAHAHSALMRAAAARVEGATARIRAAQTPPNPSLALAAPFGHDTGGLDEDVVLAQAVELPGKTRPRVRSARAEQAAAVASGTGTARDLDLSVATAYYETLRAGTERQLAADALATAQAFAAAAATQFQAGDVARSNVVRSGIETARAQQALDAADAEHANRTAALRSLAGLPPDAALMLTDALAYRPAAFSLADLQQRALRSRPDLLAAQRLNAARRADVSAARAENQPDLFVEARHATLNPSKGGSSLRVGVTLPFLDLGRNRADVSAARAALREQEANSEEAIRAALLDVETAYNTLMAAQKTAASFQTGRLDRAKELLDMAQTGYQNGASSYLELLDAQQVYRSEQVEYARALADHAVALATLARAVGEPLP